MYYKRYRVLPALQGPAENTYRFERRPTYKVCGNGFVPKENLIVFGVRITFCTTNAIGFCSRFKARLKIPIGLKGVKPIRFAAMALRRRKNLIVFGIRKVFLCSSVIYVGEVV